MNDRSDAGFGLWVFALALVMLPIGAGAIAKALNDEMAEPAEGPDQAAEFERGMRRDDPVVDRVFQAVDDVCACERRSCADRVLNDPELAEAMAELVERQAFEQSPHPNYTGDRAHIWRAHVSAKLRKGHRCAEAR